MIFCTNVHHFQRLLRPPLSGDTARFMTLYGQFTLSVRTDWFSPSDCEEPCTILEDPPLLTDGGMKSRDESTVSYERLNADHGGERC